MLSEYQANAAQAKRLVEALSTEQLNWRPAASSWSVAECLAHLAASNTEVGAAMKEALARRLDGLPETGGGVPTPGFMAKIMVASLEPPPKFRASAAPGTKPTAASYGRDILDTYLASHEKFLAVIRQGATLNLGVISFRHPALPLRLPVDLGLALMAAHDRRHLWQAAQVTAAAEFPKG